jgi:hypothetical protein
MAPSLRVPECTVFVQVKTRADSTRDGRMTGSGNTHLRRYPMSNKQTDMQRPLMTSSFRDRESAERAYNAIAARGYKSDEIHVIMSDDTRKRLFVTDAPKTDMGNKALEGAGVGGAVGGAVGATLVGILAAASTLTFPGIGLLIAGPLAGALAGGAAGAAAGGLVGTLVGAGIPEERARVYETDLNAGGIVLGVKPRDDDDAHYFETEWQGQHIQQ